MLRNSLCPTGTKSTPQPIICRAIVRQIGRKMNSAFALTLGPCTARLGAIPKSCNLQYGGSVLMSPTPRFRAGKQFFFAAIQLVFFVTTLAIPASSAARKIILDTDPGSDDAMALMLALNSPELDVRAVTVVPGNVVAKQGLENALRMISLANRCDIPVAAGAQYPFFQKLIT